MPNRPPAATCAPEGVQVGKKLGHFYQLSKQLWGRPEHTLPVRSPSSARRTRRFPFPSTPSSSRSLQGPSVHAPVLLSCPAPFQQPRLLSVPFSFPFSGRLLAGAALDSVSSCLIPQHSSFVPPPDGHSEFPVALCRINFLSLAFPLFPSP